MHVRHTQTITEVISIRPPTTLAAIVTDQEKRTQEKLYIQLNLKPIFLIDKPTSSGPCQSCFHSVHSHSSYQQESTQSLLSVLHNDFGNEGLTPRRKYRS